MSQKNIRIHTHTRNETIRPIFPVDLKFVKFVLTETRSSLSPKTHRVDYRVVGEIASGHYSVIKPVLGLTNSPKPSDKVLETEILNEPLARTRGWSKEW